MTERIIVTTIIILAVIVCIITLGQYPLNFSASSPASAASFSVYSPNYPSRVVQYVPATTTVVTAPQTETQTTYTTTSTASQSDGCSVSQGCFEDD